MVLLSVDKIYEYFNEFVQSGHVITLAGFYKFLLLDKKFTPASFRDLQTVLADNKDFLHAMKAICEGDLITQGLQGTINSTMAQFVLKSKYKYNDLEDDNKETLNLNISIDPRSMSND